MVKALNRLWSWYLEVPYGPKQVVGWIHMLLFFFKAGKCFVMRTCYCKYKFLEIFRLLRYADMRTMELSETFHQVTQLLRNTFKIVLL